MAPKFGIDFTSDISERLTPGRGLMVAMQWQTLPSAYLPVGPTMLSQGKTGPIVQGVELHPNTQHRIAYWPYDRDPRGTWQLGMGMVGQTEVPADEFHHVFVPAQTGSLRPEVPLAPGILRALVQFQTEDANSRNMLTSQYLTVMLEEDHHDNEDTPDENEIAAALEDIVLSPGLIARLPTGIKAKMMAPPANPNFQVMVRTNLLYICAGLGTPVHEVTGDYETITERAMSFAGISLRRKSDIEHEMLEHQALNAIRRAFIDAAVSIGLWTPPPGLPAWAAYRCEWQWPALTTARLSQELGTMIKAIDAGVIDPDTVTTGMFGMRPEVRDRRAAKAGARATVLGLKTNAERFDATGDVAARILDEAESEEARERDVVEESYREDSAIDP